MIKNVPLVFRIFDYLMAPIMFILGKGVKDSIQETHPWHIQEISPKLINPKMATDYLAGNDRSRHIKHNVFLFHAPILGGWTRYSVYEVSDKTNLPFYVGWVGFNEEKKEPRAYVHRLPINSHKVRLLNGTHFYTNSFFALDRNHIQVPIRKSAEGNLGSNEHSDIRLF